LAYPFTQFPKFGEFIQIAGDEFQCSLKDLAYPVIPEGGAPLSIHYLERLFEGKTLTYVIDIQDFESRMTPTLLRSICTRLKIPLERFNLDLG
jgi:L-2-hydroxyglutarate oxidase LhgO